MIPVSDDYKKLTQKPHTAISRMDIIQENVVVATLYPHSGQVDTDRNAAVMRRFDARISDATGELTPSGIKDLLAPFGTIVRLYRGLKIPLVTSVSDLDDSNAQWNEGTRVGTSAESGDLVLGTI
jgi:hypothetical protein